MFQRVTLIGNLGSDPESRFTPGGTQVTNFSVATTERLSKNVVEQCPDGWKESYNGNAWELTTWWRVAAWGNLAKSCADYLEKGRQVYVEGRVTGEAVDGNQNPRVWAGKDGVSRASFEIRADFVRFLGGRDSGSGSATVPAAVPPGFVDKEDIPF